MHPTFEEIGAHKNNTIHSDGVTIMGWVMGLEPTIFRATI